MLLGNFRVNSKADIPEALEALKDRPLYAEKWAYFKMVSHTLQGVTTSKKLLTLFSIGIGCHGHQD